MREILSSNSSAFGSYSRIAATPAGWLDRFHSIIESDPRMSGRVLDIGCGQDGPSTDYAQRLYTVPSQLDGIDPMPPRHGSESTYGHRWTGLLESADLPEAAYDAAFSIYVIEHVSDPKAFLTAISKLLAPGGVYYAYGPHGRHPFAACVRLADTFGPLFKSKVLNKIDHVGNSYPAYYRLSSRGGVRRGAKGLPFSEVEFYYHPNLGFVKYFPKAFRFVPSIYEYILGVRFRIASMGFMFRIQRSGNWQGRSMGTRDPGHAELDTASATKHS